MHSLKKAIALFLVLALVVQVLPISIFAVDANSNRSLNQEMNTSESKPQALKEDDSEAQNPKVLGEVSELRGETQKHFRMDDGSFIAVDYGMPVHFSEDNGKTWKDIDNTLILNQGTKTGQKQAETVASYRAVNGESSQSFAPDLQSGFLFSTQSGSHGLFFALEDTAVSPEAQGANGAEVNAQAERVRKAAPSERTEAQTGGTEADNTEPSAEPEELTETEERNAVNEPAEAEKAEEALPVEELACEENATEEAETVENETLPTEASEAEPSETAPTETQALPEAEADESAAEETEAAEEDYSASVRAEISYPNRRGSKDNSVQQKRSAFKGNGLASSKETDECALSVAEQVAPEKLRADVLYRNVYQDVDLRYELYGWNVKETIVLKQPRSSYSFSFYMNLTDLQPELTEDGSVELRDEQGEVVYLIPAPYMIDAKGVASTEAYYTLEQTASGAWKLTVKASETWINAEDRAFPVEIDPTLISYAGAKDCHIYTSYVDSNKKESAAYYNTGFLRCGYAPSDSNCKGHTVGLLYFEELPKIPSHCVVTDAQLSLYQINGYKGGSFTQKLYATTISTPSNPKNYLNAMTWNKYLSEISGKYAKLGEASEVTVLDYHVERNHCWIESTYVITDAVQQWYDPNGSSISRLLVLDDGHNGTSEARATYAGYTSNGYRPIICVTYRNIAGIEGIYGYHTQNIGRAGTGYVNNFTMQPSLSVPVMSAPSGILPFGISLYYNEVLSYSHFTSSTTLAVNYGGIHTLPYANAKTGYGWKTSVQQTVRYVLYDLDGDYSTEYDQSKWLIYTDADGTEHYFYKANGGIGTIYKDEDGLGLTIETNSLALYTMTDKEKNKWEFSYGYLTQYTDNHGNKLFYAYDGHAYNEDGWKPKNNSADHRVTGVWRQNDGGTLQKIAALTYSSDGYLTEIKDAASRATKLTYDASGCLTKLTYPDGKTATYSYDAKELGGKTYYRITQASDNEANYRIQYTYRNNKSLQVASITESVKDGNNWISGQRVNCYLNCANHASFRYFDGGNFTGNGKLVTQHYFDHWGRTVNVVTMDPNTSEVLGVSTGAYTETKPESSKNNRLTNSASAGIMSTNLLKNADMEHETSLYGWTKVGTGTAATGGKTAGMKAKPYQGQKLMRIKCDTDQGLCTAKQSVYLETQKTYVFSAYVNTAEADNLEEKTKAYLTIQQQKNNTVTIHAESRAINYKTNLNVDGGWERLELTFTPEKSGTYDLVANVKYNTNYVLFDDLQMEKAVSFAGPDAGSAGGKAGAASVFNLIQASSFEYPDVSTGAGNRTDVNQWWNYDASKACPVNQLSGNKSPNGGSYVLTVAPNMSGKQRATQTIQINDSSNKTYILSGWGLTPLTNNTDRNRTEEKNKLEEDNKNECRFFGLIAKVSYVDTSIEPDYHYVSFNDSIDQWQFASGVIVPKQRNKTVSTITVSACLDYCANRVYMDNISLIQEPVQTYDYDEEGNLISATNSEGKTSTEMDDDDRLKKYTAMNGVSYELSYAGASRDPATITSDGVTTSYSYDAAGNVTNTRTEAGGQYIESSTTYVNSNTNDQTLNFPYKATDTNGNDSYTTYDKETGLLQNSKNSKGVQTNNIYDTSNNRILSSYISKVAALLHLYDEDNGMLNQLTRKAYHGSQVTRQAYSFDYDAWGNTTSIHVWKPTGDADTTPGSATQLSAYTYDSAGKMTRMEYPSGQYVRYDYDSLDRLVSEKYYSSDNAVQAEYQYIYSADGQLARQQVIRNGAVTESYSFEYDSLGRLIRSREEGGSGIVQRTEHLYDTANRLTNQNWKVGDRDFKEIYKYNSDDGTMASMEIKYDCGNSGWGYVTDKLSYSYDALNRLTKVLDSENATQLYTRNYQYQDISGSRTTSRLAQFDYRKPNGGPIIYGNSYEYDKNGNITQIKEVFTVGSTEKSRVLAKYEYDKLNQMTKETRYTYSGTSTTAASTTVVSYDLDMAGNLYAVTENGSVKLAYAYGDPTWADKLTAVTVNGTTRTIQYADALNPATWYNGTDYTDLTWTQGRRLSSITKGSQTYSYEYDMSGVRSVKIAEGLKHEYVTQNGHVVRDTVTNAGTGAFQYMLDFTYDESGHPLTMRRYKNEAQTSYNTYHYVVNGQGDVVKLLHGTNTTVAEYTYDAWGNVLSKSGTLADINPLRYRGYYCDTETGFYYLQSRYYDPAVRRFINADSYTSTGQGFLGYNMFAYCNNNPANGDDPTGYSMDWPREAYCSGAPGAGDSCGGGGDGIAAVIIILIGIFIVAHESAYAEIPSYAIPQSEAQIIALSSSNSKPNRPSIRKVTLDMEHILSGHSSGGNRGPNKDRFPSWMTPALIEKAIRFAYENAEKAGSMQYSWPKNGLGEVCKQFFIGHWGGMEIHFWFNYTMKIIETAWPK